MHNRWCLLTDIDECAEEIDKCDKNAFCFNADGSYACRCVTPYFSGDGLECSGKYSELLCVVQQNRTHDKACVTDNTCLDLHNTIASSCPISYWEFGI